MWNLEYEENLQARVGAERCKRISGVQGVKWDKCGTERADNYIFFMVGIFHPFIGHEGP
jgi:hypothetical protein